MKAVGGHVSVLLIDVAGIGVCLVLRGILIGWQFFEKLIGRVREVLSSLLEGILLGILLKVS